MAFNIQDKQSVSSAQDAGLSKAQEIAAAVLALVRQGLAQLREDAEEQNQPAAGEAANDTDPNISNEQRDRSQRTAKGAEPAANDIKPTISKQQHDLYQRTVEAYEKAGVEPQTAQYAAIDSAIRGKGAQDSPHIQKAHEQITEKYFSQINTQQTASPAQAEVADQVLPLHLSKEAHSPSLRSRLVAAGVDIGDAKAISKQRDAAMSHAESVAKGETKGEFPLTPVKTLLAETGLSAKAQQHFLTEFHADLRDITQAAQATTEGVVPAAQSEQVPQSKAAVKSVVNQSPQTTVDTTVQAPTQSPNRGVKSKRQTLKMQKAYQAQLEASGSSAETAPKAAKDLAEGKGANESSAVRQAHQEVLAHQHLKAMYERIYTSLEVPPEVSEKAANDAAKGLGANTSPHIQQAHDLSQARDISPTVDRQEPKTSKTKATGKSTESQEPKASASTSEPKVSDRGKAAPQTDSQKWTKYSTAFKKARAEKYPGDNTPPSAHMTMTGAAVEAFKAGESKSDVISMLENSPMNNPPKGNKTTQAKGITTKAEKIATAQMNGTANVISRSKSKAKTKSKGKGIGIG